MEPATPASIITGYVIPLALIGAVARIVGSVLHLNALLFIALAAALGFVLQIVSVAVVGFIADALAPSFGGQKNLTQGIKLAAYSNTPALVAAALFVLGIIPILGTLIAGLVVFVAALYGLYVLYLGVGPVMGVPQEKAVGYAVVIIIIAFVVSLVIGGIVGAVAAFAAIGAAASSGAFSH
jgi:hypothetical protein